jgi:hypothetical protein
LAALRVARDIWTESKTLADAAARAEAKAVIERWNDRLAELVRSFAHTEVGDRYLFLAYDWAADAFKLRVLVA